MSNNRSRLRMAAAVVIVGLAITVYFLRPAADGSAPATDESTATVAALPRLLDLGADRCIPCKKMAPILEELKVDYDGIMTVDFIDVWKFPDAAEPYGIKVIPTQIFFASDGTELFRHEGFYGREDILTKWRELGVEMPDKGA